MNLSSFRAAAFALAGLFALNGAASAESVKVVGAGASFPFPIYSAWFNKFGQLNPGVRIDYQSQGSGAGVRNFISRIVDFAASDAAMTDEEIAQVKGGVVILPMTAGEIVLAYNLPGVAELKLPREVYPLIFSGEITRWSDPRIAAANPGVKLPDQQITVTRRSDASGTNFVFTKHLSEISPAFKEKVGSGATVQWPAQPNFVGAPRNDGIAATVMQTPGAIGYVEYGFAKMAKLPMAKLQNASGEFVAPGPGAGQAALASADFSGPDLRVWVLDPKDPAAYPIVTFTWMLFFRELGNERVSSTLRDFVTWAQKDGQAMADGLGYIPLPEKVVTRVLSEVPNIR